MKIDEFVTYAEDIILAPDVPREKRDQILKQAISMLQAEWEKVERAEADVKKWIKIAGENQKSANKCEADNVALRKRAEKAEGEVKRCYELLCGARCVYCGEVVGRDRQNQEIADEVLKRHIETCPKHPVAVLRKRVEELREQYDELIMSVGNKYPNETRHLTALRYIQQAENKTDNVARKALKEADHE